jgi:phage anti-repressor protein
MLRFNPKLAALINGDGANARALHAALDVEKPYLPWIRLRIKQYRLEPQMSFLHAYKPGYGHLPIAERPLDTNDYFLLPDTVKEIAMREPGDQGDWVREYFIDCATTTMQKWDAGRDARKEAFIASLEEQSAEQPRWLM